MDRVAAGRYMFASFTLDTAEERVWKALAPFTEGFDTPDLVDARTALAE